MTQTFTSEEPLSCIMSYNDSISWADLADEEDATNPGWDILPASALKFPRVAITRPLVEQDCMTDDQAYTIQKTLNIDLFVKTILSKESREIQKKGFKYSRVLTPQ